MTQKRTNKDDAAIKLEDSLNRLHIKQKLLATLNFSRACIETKKLCVLAEIGIFTIFSNFYRQGINSNLAVVITLICAAATPILFWIVDSIFYFYQRKLRSQMDVEESLIRNRHKLKQYRDISQHCNLCSIIKALFNGSQVMYGIILTIVGIIVILVITFGGAFNVQ